MTKTEELLKLYSEAAERTPGEWGKGDGYYGYIDAKDGRYVCTLHNHIKQLIELVRLQHEALKCRTASGPYVEAIAAFERFEKGE